jgi:hypothetical protein
MMNGLKAEFRELKNAAAGRRFLACYERHQAREASWLKPLVFFAAIFSLVIGVVLAFIPGPAILFFAIAAALLAAESRFVATTFDKLECWARRTYKRLWSERKKHSARATTKALSPQAVAVIAARAARIQEEKARREGERPVVRASAEFVPQAPAQPEAGAGVKSAGDMQSTGGAAESGDRDSQREALVPPAVAATPIAASKPTPRATQAYAPNMLTRPRQAPARVAGTVKLWAGELPPAAPQPSKSTARQRRPRKRATKPSIVTLPPPVVIGGDKA